MSVQENEVMGYKRPSSNSYYIVSFGLLVVFTIFVGLGVWAGTAPLAKAVSAIAKLSIKGDRKKIQHFEGGIVASIHVSEGQGVKKGQLLVRLDPLQAEASVARHHGQLDQLLVREMRLESELREEKSITLSGLILERLASDRSIMKIVNAEQEHFFARREALDGQVEILKQRIQQLNNEIDGLQIQKASRLEQYQIFKEEIVGLRELYQKGFYPRSKVLAMERAIVELRGTAGNDSALIARAISARGEARNQIVNLKQRYREELVRELKDVKVEISDFKERLLVAKDVLQRIEIRAPREGIIQGITVHTVGGVVKPGDLLMEIAPQDDELLVKAQISPQDIDSVAVGQKAEIRLTALNARTTPAIYGNVISVSGDSLSDSSNNIPYFLAMIDISDEERAKIGKTKLSAGMPAEVLIQTGKRTAFDYLIKPITDAMYHGLNEE